MIEHRKIEAHQRTITLAFGMEVQTFIVHSQSESIRHLFFIPFDEHEPSQTLSNAFFATCAKHFPKQCFDGSNARFVWSTFCKIQQISQLEEFPIPKHPLGKSYEHEGIRTRSVLWRDCTNALRGSTQSSQEDKMPNKQKPQNGRARAKTCVLEQG